jgi:malonyl-CoA/methylmalonyl-CoA synthetase
MRSPFIARLAALAESPRIAVEDDLGSRSFTELYARALHVREALCDGAPSLEGRRIALLAEPGAAWVESFFGILLGGGVALPLSPLYPPSELAWFAADAEADAVILSPELAPRAEHLVQGRRVLTTADLAAATEPLGHALRAPEAVAAIAPEATAMLLYTSGTTGKPKGAMLTHANLATQTQILRDAWAIDEADTLLHALPLHHLHGLGISLLTALLAGARARMLPRFDARRVWDEIERRRCTLWMAVPTMYQKLLELFDAQHEDTRARWAAGARALRLATSGSAALPVTMAARWEAITGAIPLERFGMTEIGVGMSNPLAPSSRRRGSVGLPLPSVMWRILDDAGRDTETGPGELLIRGPSVFAGYFRRAEATAATFTEGWFRTGDIAERSVDGYLRLLGRTSVDILKSGGYKLSALEVEEVLRDNPAVAEVAVIGLPDETWGERVVAIVVPAPGSAAACAPELLRAWAKTRLVSYKVPREILLTAALPRNPMGKVVKPELRRAVLAGEIGGLDRS